MGIQLPESFVNRLAASGEDVEQLGLWIGHTIGIQLPQSFVNRLAASAGLLLARVPRGFLMILIFLSLSAGITAATACGLNATLRQASRLNFEAEPCSNNTNVVWGVVNARKRELQ